MRSASTALQLLPMFSTQGSGLDQTQRSFFDQDEEDDQVLNDDIQTQYSNRDTILFLIDCSPKMFVPDENGRVPARLAFECVSSVLTSKIFSSESDLVGVLLFGTDKKKNAAEHEHIYMLQHLDIPDAQRIKETDALATGEVDLQQEYGSTSDEYPLGNVFWTCTDVFSMTAHKKGAKRIFLITNDDNPHADNINLKNAAIRRAKDLWEVGIRIELFGLDSADHEFDTSLFYKDVVAADSVVDADEERQLDAREKTSTKLDELLTRVRRKEVKKRSQFRIPLHIAEGLTIGVRGYATVLEQKRGTAQRVATSGQQLREVETVTQWKCADTGQFLLPTDVRYYCRYGGKEGEKIVFIDEDLQKMRNFGDTGLTLIGFKPQTSLLSYYNIAHAYFIYPSESEYEGSTRTFSALLKSMAKKKRIAICSFIRRTNALPKIVALCPQLEELDENGNQLVPPGFQVITLPFADDIRPLPVESTPGPKEGDEDAWREKVDLAKQFIERLSLKRFDPTPYKNPSLQRHYATLQAIALDRSIEDTEDCTLPNFEVIENRLGPYIPEFKAAVGLDKESADKHEREEDSQEHRKRAKSDKTVEQHWQEGTMTKCTLVMLKEWLKDNGTKPRGNKAELIEQASGILELRNQQS